jgi:hypothetical protein
MDWHWAQNSGSAVSHGWKPESGFLPYRWQGYCEALLLYLLGLGSPTHPLSADAYRAWLSTHDWRELYGHAHVYAGPLFIHQLSHADYMRDKDIDLKQRDRYGFEASFNLLFPGGSDKAHGWRSEWNYGINQGPIVLMVENHRTGLPWRLMRRCGYVAQGLRRAGFAGGWLV